MMPKKSPTISVKPDVLKWLRESSGWTINEVSKRLNITEEWIKKWESGDENPTLNEIKELSDAYKRPLAAFFLPSPVKEPSLPQDFRRLPGASKPFSRKTLRAIHKAMNLQDIGRELLENLNLDIETDVSRANLRDDPEKVAREERHKLGVSIEDQFKWKNPYEAFKAWRSAIEQKNILVFQFPMELEELRGFTLLELSPYAIVVNSSDIVEARIFTLIHEYGHILLREPALCTPETPLNDGSHGASVERWCNQFAGAFLLPSDDIKSFFERCGLTKYSKIASRYKVSRAATLTRLVNLRLISLDKYNEEMSKLPINIYKEQGGIGKPSKRIRQAMGDTFISLVLENSHKGFITNNDALSYLGIKTAHLKELLGHKS
ncbi:XRE family transcriptional regulator [Methanocella conradii]|uniref:XRE family transcriptional regulator n=1 Tax=Methanocella conradii TaxID=1175444 RepID=UPI0024B3A12B|nr:XRE family transcriptional regulator [Methanocella conradii]MDI6897076.1 XRE family transcriptional regulator [Methanocella conradii]